MSEAVAVVPRLFPRAVYRVSATDVKTLQRLRLNGWQEVLELEVELDNERLQAVSAIYALVPNISDRAERIRLLNVKRALATLDGAVTLFSGPMGSSTSSDADVDDKLRGLAQR